MITITDHMPGDILFYGEVTSDVIDVAIADWTNSKLVHTAIAISAMQKIEAVMQGVVITPIIASEIALSWSYTKNVPQPNAANLASALQWLHSQVGQMYGYGDVVEAILYKFEHGLVINLGDHFDCSALATEFLMKAGGVPGLQNTTNPHEITPVVLAHLLNVPNVP